MAMPVQFNEHASSRGSLCPDSDGLAGRLWVRSQQFHLLIDRNTTLGFQRSKTLFSVNVKGLALLGWQAYHKFLMLTNDYAKF